MHRAPQHVVVIGGGIAGASISRVLANAGVRVTLLEKSGMLCSGSTWHAAGLVTRYAGGSKLKKVHVRALALLNELHASHGIGLHTPGSIRIVERGNAARLLEAKQQLGMAALFDEPGLATRLISREEVKELHPLVDVSQVECGLFTPLDGDVDPTTLTNVVAGLAKAAGATVRLSSRVTGVSARPSGGFVVAVHGGAPVECDTVVNAAGLWSRGVSEMCPQLPAHHPAFVIEHQYAITEPVPEVRALAAAGHNGGRLPVLRDLRGSSYIRQEGAGFLIGPYEDTCVVRQDFARGPPPDFDMELFPDDLARIEANLLMGIELVPCLGTVGFKTVVNGPTIWTGDSLARCGRTNVPGWYDFNSLTYGIAQSLALAEYLGHIMLHGEQPAGFDASDSFDPLRYGAWASDPFVVAKVTETYTYNNKTTFPYENRSGGRAHVRAPYPLHDVLRDLGARFGPTGGAACEVPLCYDAAPGADAGAGATPLEVHDQRRFSHFAWAPRAEAEARHVLSKVGIAYSSFSKIRVRGPGCKQFMEHATTGVLPAAKAGEDAPGDQPARLTYCTTPRGRVQTEFTICRNTDQGDDWYLVGSRDHVRQDLAWLKQTARPEWALQFEDLTDQFCVLHLCGPSSGELLGAIEPRVKGLNFMRARTVADFAGIRGLDVRVFRVSFSGEMGFELHVASGKSVALHKHITGHRRAKELDLQHVGSAAINALRIERAFKFRADLDFAHYSEAGIDAFLAKKRAFNGHDPSFVPQRRAAQFRIQANQGWEWSVQGDSPIRSREDGRIVGYTTTSARGATTGDAIALGYTVNADFDPAKHANERLEIEAFGFTWPATYLPQPIKGVDRTVW